MHGYGSNGHDMYGVAEMIYHHNKSIIQDSGMLFIAPDAPFKWEGDSFFNSEGKQWFSLQSRDEDKIISGIENVIGILKYNLEKWLKQYNLTWDKLFLSGFSQGGMLSAYLGIRLPNKIAGIISFSGTLMGIKTIEADIVSKPDICFIHGDQDEVLPSIGSRFGNKILLEHDVKSEIHIIKGMGHSINHECIDIASKFLDNRL